MNFSETCQTESFCQAENQEDLTGQAEQTGNPFRGQSPRVPAVGRPKDLPGKYRELVTLQQDGCDKSISNGGYRLKVQTHIGKHINAQFANYVFTCVSLFFHT